METCLVCNIQNLIHMRYIIVCYNCSYIVLVVASYVCKGLYTDVQVK